MIAADDLSPSELESLLRFYADAGVDAMLDPLPIDRFAEPPASERAARDGPARGLPPGGDDARPRPDARPDGSARPASMAPRTTLPAAAPPASAPAAGFAIPDEAALLDARAQAASAHTLDDLARAVAAFTGCNLRLSAKNAVFADGNPEADIMFVGEAPGREEDIQGLPFVGRAGQLLDRMLAAIGLDRRSAYITNMIPWRPPGNRNPTPHEIELCRPFVERHIELAAPKILVLLGNVSNKALMNTNRGILAARGTWGTYAVGARAIAAMPTLHPAYLLRNPAHKRLAWQDFIEIRIKLDALGD